MLKIGPIEINLIGTEVVITVDGDDDKIPSVSLSVNVVESIDEVKKALDK